MTTTGMPSDCSKRRILASSDSKLPCKAVLLEGKQRDSCHPGSSGVLIPSDRKPIWTAFITHQILSPTWMSRDSPRVVHIADLQRYIFTEEYNPQRTPEGAHELTFIEPAGTCFPLAEIL